MFITANDEIDISLKVSDFNTIISCMCEHIRDKNSMIDMYRASSRRLECELVAMKEKYEGHVADKEEEEFLNV